MSHELSIIGSRTFCSAALAGPFHWSLPDDAVRWAALILAPLCAIAARRLKATSWARLALAAPFVAAALSAGYIAFYLRGGPRVIDATAYWLEARGLSHGLPALPLSEPEQATVGRFLLRTDWHGPAASVIFPPGWPAVLALGFLVGAPMAMGPLIAALVCLATGWLARIAERQWQALRPEAAPERGQLVAAAMLFSAACAVLRYHTADTMSHGWAALCFATALAAATSAARSNGGWRARAKAALAGLSAGWLFATRPVSALALTAALIAGAACGWLDGNAPAANGARAGWSRKLALFGALIAGAAPPIALWLWYQHAATGSWLAVAQTRYYALSDGPPGCFRYGFGRGIGCLGEHEDFVRAHLTRGYGLGSALGVTGRRLLLHASDALDFGPLCLLPLLGAWRGRSSMIRLLAAAVAAQLLAYAPFYFDGSYPGGGARLYADVLPLEHVLAAAGIAALSRRRQGRFARLSGGTLAIALAGFSLGTGADHAALRDRDAGRPMFEPAALARAGVDPARDLILFDTDHGFDLALAPGARVARYKGDALDLLSWERFGRPRAWLYRNRAGGPELSPVRFDPRPIDTLALNIEGESLWPPRWQRGGWAWPEWRVPGCASGHKALMLHGGAEALVIVALPRAAAGRRAALRVIAGDSPAAIDLLIDGRVADRWQTSARAHSCAKLDSAAVPARADRIALALHGGGWALDALDLGEKLDENR